MNEANETTARIAAIRGRLGAATPAPWRCEKQAEIGPFAGEFLIYAGGGATKEDFRWAGWVGLRDRADADLTANAPADLAWCLGEIERLTRDLRETEEASCDLAQARDNALTRAEAAERERDAYKRAAVRHQESAEELDALKQQLAEARLEVKRSRINIHTAKVERDTAVFRAERAEAEVRQGRCLRQERDEARAALAVFIHWRTPGAILPTEDEIDAALTEARRIVGEGGAK